MTHYEAARPDQHVLHQQLIASDAARTQLRDALQSYLKTLPDQHPPAIEGVSVATPADVWACKNNQSSPSQDAPASKKLLVGQPHELMVRSLNHTHTHTHRV